KGAARKRLRNREGANSFPTRRARKRTHSLGGLSGIKFLPLAAGFGSEFAPGSGMGGGVLRGCRESAGTRDRLTSVFTMGSSEKWRAGHLGISVLRVVIVPVECRSWGRGSQRKRRRCASRR